MPMPEQRLVQLHRLVAEDARVHHAGVAHDGREVHLREDVALDVDSRRDLDQLHAVASAAEHAALGHVEHRLPVSAA